MNRGKLTNSRKIYTHKRIHVRKQEYQIKLKTKSKQEHTYILMKSIHDRMMLIAKIYKRRKVYIEPGVHTSVLRFTDYDYPFGLGFKATFNNNFDTSRPSVLLLEDTGVLGENHRPAQVIDKLII